MLCSFLLILIAWSIRLFLILQNTGIFGNQIAEHICKATPFVNRSDVCDKDHLRVLSLLQSSRCRQKQILPSAFVPGVGAAFPGCVAAVSQHRRKCNTSAGERRACSVDRSERRSAYAPEYIRWDQTACSERACAVSCRRAVQRS